MSNKLLDTLAVLLAAGLALWAAWVAYLVLRTMGVV